MTRSPHDDAMPHEPPPQALGPDAIPIPGLLRAARGSYALTIRSQLLASGFEDLPRNGPYVLGGMVNGGGTMSDLIRDLRVSKQSASQLIDTLVDRGYLERTVDPLDRRRVTVEPTGRGRAAAAAVRRGVRQMDEELTRRIAARGVAGLRAGLVALIAIKEDLETAMVEGKASGTMDG